MSVFRKINSLFLRNKNIFCTIKFQKNFQTSCSYHAIVPFNLSDIGEGIREVVVKEWFVKEGDKVAQFDNICEVQSDKASVTITSRYDGVIKKLYYRIDDTAHVGKPLLDIETESEDVIVEHQTIQTEVNSNDKEMLCTPSVRRLAKEYNVDLSQVHGTGKQGRILKEDVLKYLKLDSEEDLMKSTSKQTQNKTYQDTKTVPLEGFKKAMVKTMTNSLKIPHFVYSDEIIVTKLQELRNICKTEQNFKVSFMPFFVKAVSNALKTYPILNATLDENCENITYKTNHNIAIAMDTKVGLAVPVIKNVQNLGILEISNELNRLMKSGKNGVFSPDDLSGGTFTLSNIGIIGGTYTSPIIMPPMVSIIAIGAVKVLPRFDKSNNIIPEAIINLSAAADHRIIDGATMARFIELFKKQIENPYLIFL